MAAKRSGVDIHQYKPNKIKPGKDDTNRYGTIAFVKDSIHKIVLKDICKVFLIKK